MNERIIDDGGTEVLEGEVTFGPFSNPLLRQILDQFGKAAFGRSCACMEFEGFLKTIGASGKCCLEIGTYHGITAVVLSQYFEQVVCVSIDEDPKRLLKHDIVHALGINNITFHDAANNNEKRRIVENTDFDFAFMDGDHAHDTRSDFAMVKHCGRVLFHEAWVLAPQVWNLVNALPQHEVTRAKVDSFAFWKRGG